MQEERQKFLQPRGGTAGTWNSTAKTITWTPNAYDNYTYFAFYQNGKVANGTNKLATSDAIVVTYETTGGSSTTTIDAPTFTVPEGAVTAGTVVNINNPNDNYIYYYTTDGTTPDVDDDLVVLGTTRVFDTENGLTINATTTLKAIAVDEDVNKSSVTSATYTIPYANIAALTAATTSSTAATSFVILSDAVVTYVNGNYAYIQDASGAIAMYKSEHGLTAGDVLNGTATVTYALRYGNPQLTDISGITPTQGETTPMPTEVAAANWNKTFNNELSKYYKITDATITENDGKYYISLGGQSVQLYGQGEAKNFTLSNLTKKYTIVGFPTLFVSGENTTLELQIFEVPEIQTYQITPVVNNSAYGTVEYDNGVIIATPAEGYRFATPAYSVTSGTATITQDGNEFTVDAQTDCTVQINFEAIPSHTATFSVNGTTTTQDFAEDAAISFPSTPADVNGKTFVGWTTNTIEGTTNTAPTFVTSATMGTENVTYYAVFATLENAGSSKTVTDVLTLETTGIEEGTTTYSNWSGKTVTSSAVYAGQSAGGNKSIQLRSANSNSGIISTASGGKLKKIEVDWNSNTTSGRRIRVFGKNTAYSEVSDVYAFAKQGTQIGGEGPEFDITYGKSTELTVNGDYEYIGIRSMDGALYLNSISITWENSIPATYSGYCTTVESEEPVVEPGTPVEIAEGFYTIMNNGNNQYVNVAGRRTVTFVDEDATTTAPGTVIKVKADKNGQVQILRSQGVDIPGYAQKAMNYVPEIVQLVVEKLNNLDPDQQIMGEGGMQALLDAFNAGFDYHLYTEQANDGIRIYGKTPSMQPVVDFYADPANTANVDAKLPMLESLINKAIDKVLEKTGGSGASILQHFSLANIWTLMGSPSDVAQPTEDTETQKAFLQWVLGDKDRVWNFAYQTAMIYWKPLINHEMVQKNLQELGDYAQYIEKLEYIRPEVKYYLVQNNGKLDVFSQDNPLLEGTSEWTLDECTKFKVTVPEDNELNGKYYTTFYADFAYTLPEGVKAMTVAKVSELNGKNIAITEAIEGAVPAQTPVLLESGTAGDVELTLDVTDGTAIENLLKGNDWLINECGITTPTVDKLFGVIHDLFVYENMKSYYDQYVAKYEHLKARNAGTVNNKYFFELSGDDIAEAEVNIGQLTKEDLGLAFSHNLERAAANKAFLPSDKDPIYLSFVGDVDRDGDVDYDDVTALVKIVLGKVTEENNVSDGYNYDFEAANVNEDVNGDINIADVTALVNIILGKN